VSRHTSIDFLFESGPDNRYADVLGDSALVSGRIVTQNAGSSDLGLYYQVCGGGLNGRFERGLGTGVDAVNARLRKPYDARFGAGRFDIDSLAPPSPPVLTSLLVPLDPALGLGDRVAGMAYSVGPKLTRAGLTPGIVVEYMQIYVDALTAIALCPDPVDGFRITMLSSGIYRGDAPIEPFADAAAGAVIEAVRAAVRNSKGRLSGLTILINTDREAIFPLEVDGFTHAAAAAGVKVDTRGFTLPIA